MRTLGALLVLCICSTPLMSWLIWCWRGAADCAVFRWEQAAHSCYSRQPKPRKAQWMCNVSGMVYQLFFFKYLQSCLLGIVCVWKWDSNLIKCYDLSLSCVGGAVQLPSQAAAESHVSGSHSWCPATSSPEFASGTSL